jgi:hypothetical protein
MPKHSQRFLIAEARVWARGIPYWVDIGSVLLAQTSVRVLRVFTPSIMPPLFRIHSYHLGYGQGGRYSPKFHRGTVSSHRNKKKYTLKLVFI